MLESIEARVLLSAFLDTKGVLRVFGTDAADTITLTQRRTVITVAINSLAPRRFTVGTFRALTVQALGGDDTVMLSASNGNAAITVPARVAGGDGNDSILGGAGDDSIGGDDGADTIDGAAGNDTLSGDFIVAAGEPVPQDALTADAADVIRGGLGNDTVTYANRIVGVVILPAESPLDASNTPPEDQISGVETLIGGQGDDVIDAPTLTGQLFGGAGNDTLSGANDDTLTTMFGGDGDDTFNGGTDVEDLLGNNTVNGAKSATLGPGDDEFIAGNRPTTLDGGGGNDTLEGSDFTDVFVLRGNTTADGGGGDDVFVGLGNGPDFVNGGAGLDFVEDADAVLANGGGISGTEVSLAPVFGNSPNGLSPAANAPGTAVLADGGLTVTGTDAADDIVVGRARNRIAVVINGVVAGRFAVADVADITINAGDGDDQVNLANLSDGTSIGARVRGGNGNDAIVGSAGGDVIEGGLGNDTIAAGAGNDVISGGFITLVNETPDPNSSSVDGSDVLDGGTGTTDVVTYAYRRRPVAIALDGTARVSGQRGEHDTITNVEYAIGGRGNDLLLGSRGNDLLYGGAGDDAIAGRAGQDELLGGPGSDTITPDQGNDFVESGPDTVVDSIVASFTAGATPLNGLNQIVFGAFNTQDLFTLDKTFWSAPS